jgi:hypothetical protein
MCKMLRRLTLSVILLLSAFLLPAQGKGKITVITPVILTPKVNTIFYKLGDDYIRIKTFQYGTAKEPFFINLHDDEETAVAGAVRLLETNGGVLVKIENDKKRNISFKMGSQSYAFDPNRIFSRSGIIQTLKMFGSNSPKVADEVEKFANRILLLLPANPSCIFALHNNSDGEFSVTSYMTGQEREGDAKAINAKSKQDPDDLFLTTDSLLFQKLLKEKFNVILQDNANARKDGSLSVYCGEKHLCYLNCETEHGKLSLYSEMIVTAVRLTKKPLSETIVYNYQLFPNRDSTRLSGSHDIFFGEKKIGTIKVANAIGMKSGQMEIAKSFPLYDNMDLFYFHSKTQEPRVELRIDPTRSKSLYDPEKALVIIKVIP